MYAWVKRIAIVKSSYSNQDKASGDKTLSEMKTQQDTILTSNKRQGYHVQHMSSWWTSNLYSVRLACFFSFSIFRAVSSSAVGDRLLFSSTSCIVHVVFFFLTTTGMSGSRTGSVIVQAATMTMMIKNNFSLFEGLLELLWASGEKLHVLRYRQLPNHHWITTPTKSHYCMVEIGDRTF